MHLTPLIKIAHEHNCTVDEQVAMAGLTTMRVGGNADLVITIPDEDAACAVLACCHEENIPWFWLGNGSNLLVGDRGIRGAVLRLDPHKAIVKLVGDTAIECDAGLPLKKLCLFARDNHLTGLEFAFGIPGTVGGAVYMNAGAYDGEMAQVVTSADGVTATGERVTLTANELNLSYRHSALMDKADSERIIITRVRFSLSVGDCETIAARMKELLARRQQKQPLEFPSAGSFFKRPQGHYAGALIEQVGLKGYRVGDAQVSEKHAGFVINRGSATADEMRRLCHDVQQAVYEQTNVKLEPEVRFIGEF